MRSTTLLVLALAVTNPLVSARPVAAPPKSLWNKVQDTVTGPKGTLVTKTCGLGFALVAGACVAVNTFPSNPGKTVAAGAVGLTALIPNAQGVAKEWADYGKNKQKEDMKKAWPDAKQQAAAIKAKPALDDIKNENHKPLKHVENAPTGDAKLKDIKKEDIKDVSGRPAMLNELKNNKPQLKPVANPGSDAPRLNKAYDIKQKQKQSHKLVGY
ncbi:hypothetical protein B0O99DRAFT_680930 [Bisporella sp. PMI_857]|nr:hypothetical protein B0O99DRAFT_680930 [Bisporella sp. PMI_857]